MVIIRILGGIILILALLVFAQDIIGYFTTGAWNPIILGRLWNKWSPGSLQLIQPAIERYLWPPLWGEVLFPIIRQPASLVFGVLGLILWALGRPRSRRVYRR